jgi:uncharacterized iron-regulated protein
VRKQAALLALMVVWATFGCTAQRRFDLTGLTGGSAFLFNQFQAFDGTTGRPLHFADVLRRSREADVVLFGEQHGDAVCNQLEAQLLHALVRADRPVILALEFFEADGQAAVDAYLNGRIDEAEFVEQARQRSSYLGTHRPLVELSRAARVPVVAANAPRRLVHAYRQSGLSYAGYRAGLDAKERGWLPTRSDYLPGPYRERFAAVMRHHGPTTRPASQPASAPAPALPTTAPVSQPARPRWEQFYKAQLLWDDAMAESVANVRDRFPTHRVLLIVGSFHVAHDGGTKLKLRRRRPHDRLFTIAYRANPDGQFEFREEDRGAGDVVIYGLSPPKPRAMPRPAKKPQTQPAESQPTTTPSAPARAPTRAPAPPP